MIELSLRRQLDSAFMEQVEALQAQDKFSLEISRMCFASTPLETIMEPFRKRCVCDSLTVVSCRHLRAFFNQWGVLQDKHPQNCTDIYMLTLVNPTQDGIESLTLELLSKTISIKALNINTSITPGIGTSLAWAIQGTGIEHLDLSHCYWDRRSVDALANGFIQARALKKLNLSSCHLEDSLMAKILYCLQNHTSLEELNISFNNCHSEACAAIGVLLQTSAVQRLEMSQQFIGREKSLDIQCINDALSQSTSLKYLDLKENFLDTDQLERLLVALGENESLVELDLSCADISDECLPGLAAKLDSTRLQRLVLYHNPFQNAAPLVEAAKGNANLRRIDVDTSVTSRELLYYHTALNRAGKELLSQGDRVPLGLWPLILEKAGTMDIPEDLDLQNHDVFFFMLQGPAIH